LSCLIITVIGMRRLLDMTDAISFPKGIGERFDCVKDTRWTSRETFSP
jgi:hypothetical protein